MSKDREWILEAVRTVVAESLSMDVQEICEHHALTNDLGVDSGNYLDIVCRLEKRFLIPKPQDRMELRERIAEFKTVQDLCNYAEGQLAPQESELAPAA